MFVETKDCYYFFLLGITQTTKNKNIQPFNADDYNDNSKKQQQLFVNQNIIITVSSSMRSTCSTGCNIHHTYHE